MRTNGLCRCRQAVRRGAYAAIFSLSLLRISVLGESAYKIDKPTEAALPGVPFKSLRGMRNRIAHDYGAVDFKIVWAVTQQEIAPLIRALEGYFQNHTSPGGRAP